MSKYTYDSRPGSAWMDEREEELRQRMRRDLWKDYDPTIDYSWENKAESWELEELEEYECGNCGRKGDETKVVEAVRRCGTGLGEWYCATGQGCEK